MVSSKKINVINIKTSKIDQTLWTKIDRTTPIGNPFYKGTREENIQKYRSYLWKILSNPDQIKYEKFEIYFNQICNKVLAGETVYLACWCAPKACHGYILKDAILWSINGSNPGAEIFDK